MVSETSAASPRRIFLAVLMARGRCTEQALLQRPRETAETTTPLGQAMLLLWQTSAKEVETAAQAFPARCLTATMFCLGLLVLQRSPLL